MLNIFLCRHGQNVDNLDNILNGHRDKPLTELGKKQARELAQKIQSSNLCFDYIYSSPLDRALETAKIVTSTINGPEPIIEPLLIERDFGIMTGKNKDDIESLCSPNIFKTKNITYFLDPEGAETFPVLIERAGTLLKKIVSEHKTGDILLVCHGDIGMMIYANYFNLDWKTALSKIYFGNCDLLLLSDSSSADKPFYLFK